MAVITKEICDGEDKHGRSMGSWTAIPQGSEYQRVHTVADGGYGRGKYDRITGIKCSDSSSRPTCVWHEVGEEFLIAPKLQQYACMSIGDDQKTDIDGFPGADYSMQCMLAGGDLKMEVDNDDDVTRLNRPYRGLPWEKFAPGTDAYDAEMIKYNKELADCDPKWYPTSADWLKCEDRQEREQLVGANTATQLAKRDALAVKSAANYTQKWTKTDSVYVTSSSDAFEYNTQHGFTARVDSPLRVKASLESCIKDCRGMDDCIGVRISKDRSLCTGLSGDITGYWPTRPPVGNPGTTWQSENYDYFAKDSNGQGTSPWINEEHNSPWSSKPLQYEMKFKIEEAGVKDLARKEALSKVFSLTPDDRCGGEFRFDPKTYTWGVGADTDIRKYDNLNVGWDGRPGTGTHKGMRCPGTQCCNSAGYCGGKQGESSTFCDGTAQDRKYYGNTTNGVGIWESVRNRAGYASPFTDDDLRKNLQTLEAEPASHIGSNYGNYDGLGSVIDDAERMQKNEEMRENKEFCLDERADHCKTEDMCINLKDFDGEFVCPQKPKINDGGLLTDSEVEFHENRHVVKGYPMIVDETVSGWESVDYNVPAGSTNTQAFNHCERIQLDHHYASPGFSVWREESTASNFQTDHDFKCRVYTRNNEVPEFADECVNQPWGNRTKCMKKPDNVMAVDVDGVSNEWASGGLFWRRKTIADMRESNTVGLSEPKDELLPEPGKLIGLEDKNCPRSYQAQRVDGGQHCIKNSYVVKDWQGNTVYHTIYGHWLPKIEPAECKKNGGWDSTLKVPCDGGVELDFGTSSAKPSFNFNSWKRIVKDTGSGLCPNQFIRGNQKFIIKMSECGTPSTDYAGRRQYTYTASGAVVHH